MKITWDKIADAAYIPIKKGVVAYTKEKCGWLLIDYTKNGEVVGIEILNASKNLFRKTKILEKVAV